MWKILKIKIWIGLFFKSSKHKWPSPSPAGPLCTTTVSKCYPWWAEMADGQVENFTAPQTSSALNTAHQPPKGVLWLDQVMMRLHTPLTTFLPLPLPLPFLPRALSFFLPEIPDLCFPHPLPGRRNQPGGPCRGLEVWRPQGLSVVGGWPRLAFIFWLRAL